MATQLMPFAKSVAHLLDGFLERKPVRAWSLIISIYGDAVVPRGGRLWLGSLTEIMRLFGIDAGHVRTAMSRLTADGWLERERAGRTSYYRLSRRGQCSFAAATRRIYFAEPRPFDGRLRLALLGPAIDDRAGLRRELEGAGFAELSPAAHVGLADPPLRLAGHPGVFFVTAEPGASTGPIAEAAWKLTPVAEAYRRFVERFAPLERELAVGASPDGADAMVARILLIHEFRRIVLRDPALPPALLTPDWPGPRARSLAAGIYSRVVLPAECLLDAVGRNEDGPLPPPEPSVRNRFAPPA